MKEENVTVILISPGIVTVYILQGTRSILVDTGYPGSDLKIMKKFSKNSIDPKDIYD